MECRVMISPDLLLLVAGQVLTLFLLMAVGFILAKRGKLTPDGCSQMSHLLMYMVMPCTTISALQQNPYSSDLSRTILMTFLGSAICYVAYILLSKQLFYRRHPDERDTLRFGVIYGNTGFMGLPLVMGVFGPESVIYCAIAGTMFSISSWTQGVCLMGGRENISLKKAFLNPGTIGCAIGFALFFTGLRLPSPLGAAVTHLGNMNTPLAMIIIGAQMASADLLATFRMRGLYLASAIKLFAMPLLTAALLIPFGLSEIAYSTLVLLAATPAGGITSIFAQNFRRDPTTAAQMISLSTLLSILTLPIMAMVTSVIWQFVGG